MDRESINAVTGYLYDLLHLPLVAFDKKNWDMDAFKGWDLIEDMKSPLLQKQFVDRYMIFRDDHMVSYYVSDDDIAMGCVNDVHGSSGIFVGPCLLSDLTENMVTAMTTRDNSPFRNDPDKYRDEIFAFLRSLPTVTQEEFLRLLTFINTAVNHTVLDTKELYPVPLSKKRIDLKASRIADIREEEQEEDPAAYLIRFFREAVESGDQKAVEERWLQIPAGKMVQALASRGGKGETLRHAQGIFFRFLTMLETECVNSGMGKATARNLVWKYSTAAEDVLVRKQLENLYRQVLSGFADAISSDKEVNPAGSSMVYKAMDVVSSHISDSISTAFVAEKLGISAGYLSSAFHKASGMTLTEYIKREKMRVAAELLRDTDESIGEISAYLGFSSQSYFQNTFKKVYGKTPLSYRSHRGAQD
ncbi:MAG: helix-turn-helix transcriptional regulator [Oscillospiraceae bacterium]|nr:helix-turn-helix transcriptional regulator [Oscillospiraceae bacterium]